MENLKLKSGYQARVKEFAAALAKVFADDLISVILYGSATTGEFRNKLSDLNCLVVLKDAGLASLKICRPLLARHRFALIAPVFMSEECLLNSLDVFPVEFLDMKENYVVVRGNDLLREVSIDTAHVRYQCEKGLKEAILKMKSAYLRDTHGHLLRGVMYRAFGSTLVLLRHVLAAKGRQVSSSSQEIIGLLTEEFGTDRLLLSAIDQARRTNRHLHRRILDEYCTRFVSDLEKIADALDRV